MEGAVFRTTGRAGLSEPQCLPFRTETEFHEILRHGGMGRALEHGHGIAAQSRAAERGDPNDTRLAGF